MDGFEGPPASRALGRSRPWRGRRPGRSALALVVLAPWLAWAVVRAGGLEHGIHVVPAMAFTPHVAATAWIPVVVAVLLRRPVVGVVAVATLVVLVAAVAGRGLAGPRPTVRDGIALRVMTANLHEGRGDVQAVVGLVRREHVDVLAVEELTRAEAARLDAAGLRRLLPHRDLDVRPGAAGTGLYARLPLRALAPPRGLLYNAAPRVAVRLPGGPPLEVQAVHPPPPTHWLPIWRRALAAIPPPSPSRLEVVLGDFNATLDHHALRQVLRRGYLDAGDATGEGLRPTWPTGRRFPPQIAIDHVLADARIEPTALRVHAIPGSDHRAVVAALLLPRTLAAGTARVVGSP